MNKLSKIRILVIKKEEFSQQLDQSKNKIVIIFLITRKKKTFIFYI